MSKILELPRPASGGSGTRITPATSHSPRWKATFDIKRGDLEDPRQRRKASLLGAWHATVVMHRSSRRPRCRDAHGVSARVRTARDLFLAGDDIVRGANGNCGREANAPGPRRRTQCLRSPLDNTG